MDRIKARAQGLATARRAACRATTTQKNIRRKGILKYASDDQITRAAIAVAAVVVRFFCSAPGQRSGANACHTGVRPQDERLDSQGGA